MICFCSVVLLFVEEKRCFFLGFKVCLCVLLYIYIYIIQYTCIIVSFWAGWVVLGMFLGCGRVHNP